MFLAVPFFCLIWVLVIVVSVGGTVLWIWMLIDILQRPDNEFGENFGKDAKIAWVLIILLTHAIGALIYYFLVYKKVPKSI